MEEDKKTLGDFFGKKVRLSLSPESAEIIIHALGTTSRSDHDKITEYEITKVCCLLDIEIHKATDWCDDNDSCALKENIEMFKQNFADYISKDSDVNLEDFKIE